VHSSLKGCGNFIGGVSDILIALHEFTDTLCLPTHTYCYPATVGELGPVFDPASTPSKNGLLTEEFRTRPGVFRSVGATHSMAASGPRALALTEKHESLGGPCGEGSPWSRLIQQNASVLLLGVNFRAYTPYHTAEDAAGSPYAYQEGIIDRLQYLGKDGEVHEYRSRRQSWTPRRFAEAGDLLERVGLVKRIPLGRGHLSFVRDSAKVHEFLVHRLKTTPNFLYQDCATPLE
jgi:aminoglycoside 3-N-acetyltransferase